MGRKSSVIGSQHEREIKAFLRSGWAPERIHSYLVALHGEGSGVPSAKAMGRFRATHIPPAMILPESVIKRAMRGLRYRVDTLKVLDRLIWAQEERIGQLWEQERETGVVQPYLAASFRVALEYVLQRHRIVEELGRREVGERGGRVEFRQSQALELPEASFQELMGLLRQNREQAGGEAA